MNDESGTLPTGPANLLLQTGEDAHCDESACMDLLGAADPADVDVLFVTFTKSAGDRLDALKRHADAPPARVGVVSVEVGGSNGGDRVGGPGGPTVRRISDPSDLTGVGIAISEFLSAWSGDGNRTVVCFESLTALLQYVDASRVFQFCNEITSKFERAGATAHFHITPEAHERQELSVLSSLFDGRVGAVDLGYGAGAASPTAAGADAETLETDPGAADAPDDPSADAPGDSGSTDETDDPFEYAADDGTPDPAEDAPTTDAGESTAASDTEPEDDTDPQPNGEPADLVSSVIAGEGDDADSDDADDDPEHQEDGRPEAAADAADAADGETHEPTAGAVDDAGLSETGDTGSQEGADGAGPSATARQSEHEELRRRLQYVGPGATSSDGETGDDGGADQHRTDQTAESDDPADGGDTYAFYQRTTATVVGVVVMLVLISFLSAAMPVPVTPDDAADGANVSSTATPQEVAAANESATETATEDASSPTPTAAATATPTPDPSTSSSSSTGTSDSDSTSGDGSTSDQTATPTATATPTPTATPTDDAISDTLDTDDDLL